METEGSVYRRLHRLLYRERAVESRTLEIWEAEPGQRLIWVSGPNSWAASCIPPSEDTADLLGRITNKLVVGPKVKSGDVEQIRRTLQDALEQDLKSIPESSRNEKIARIGFPLQLRLLLDSLDGGTWEEVGSDIATQWALPLVAVPYWFWHQMFSSEPIRRHEVVSTRTVATIEWGNDEPIQGMGGTLSVGLIEWPNSIDPPESHFVPHPESFGFCLDDHFVNSLSDCHTYLKNLNLWPDKDCVVLEWNLSMDQPDSVPVLNGGSAGAALTLAAGSLLARRHLQSTGSS